jgi:hypothetical protein
MSTRVECKGWSREQNEAHKMLASHGFKRISTSYNRRLGSDVDHYEHQSGHEADLMKFEDEAKWRHPYLVTVREAGPDHRQLNSAGPVEHLGKMLKLLGKRLARRAKGNPRMDI